MLDQYTEAQNNQPLGWMQRRLCCCWQGQGCHIVYSIYRDYSQGFIQPDTEASTEICADPLLTEPNSQHRKASYPALIKCLLRGRGADNVLSQTSHSLWSSLLLLYHIIAKADKSIIWL